MKIIKTSIADLLIIEPDIFKDERGYFFETYNLNRYYENGITADFIQDNEAFSNYGVLRGLHYQLAPYTQAKLVRVVQGRVLDVAVDLRRNSPTFKQWISMEISAENKRQFLVPRGFAHGYSVLEDQTIFVYKCDNVYHKASERSINPFDPSLNIDWGIPKDKILLSPKDIANPNIEDAEFDF
jgi:dTDP-4-dehydrorhamnose 3,5-epimerase